MCHPPGGQDLDHPQEGGLAEEVQRRPQDGKSACTKKKCKFRASGPWIFVYFFVPSPKSLVWNWEVAMVSKLTALTADSPPALASRLRWLSLLQ